MAMGTDAAGMGQRLGNQITDLGESEQVVPAQTQAASVFADRLTGFDQAAVGPLPSGGQEDPMGDEQPQELGIELGLDARRIPPARLVQFALVFPELEDQLN